MVLRGVRLFFIVRPLYGAVLLGSPRTEPLAAPPAFLSLRATAESEEQASMDEFTQVDLEKENVEAGTETSEYRDIPVYMPAVSAKVLSAPAPAIEATARIARVTQPGETTPAAFRAPAPTAEVPPPDVAEMSPAGTVLVPAPAAEVMPPGFEVMPPAPAPVPEVMPRFVAPAPAPEVMPRFVEPAPAPEVMALPVPAPASEVLPPVAEVTQEGDDMTRPVICQMIVENVAFDKLSDNSELLADFAVLVKETLAANAGHGVAAGDIELTLSSGSVSVRAEFSSLASVDPGAVSTNLLEARESGDLAQDIKEGLKQLPGIDSVSTGIIGVTDIVVDSDEAAISVPRTSDRPTPGMYKEPAAQPSTTVLPKREELEEEDNKDDACHPDCLDGRGICVDKICFCRNPYEGIRCEKTLESGGFRFSHALAVVIYCVATAVGVGIASAVFKAFSLKQQPMRLLGSHDARKETWRPTAQPRQK